MTARAYYFGYGMTEHAYYLGDGMTEHAYYLLRKSRSTKNFHF